jgi:hypothetical protein
MAVNLWEELLAEVASPLLELAAELVLQLVELLERALEALQESAWAALAA